MRIHSCHWQFHLRNARSSLCLFSQVVAQLWISAAGEEPTTNKQTHRIQLLLSLFRKPCSLQLAQFPSDDYDDNCSPNSSSSNRKKISWCEKKLWRFFETLSILLFSQLMLQPSMIRQASVWILEDWTWEFGCSKLLGKLLGAWQGNSRSS